MTATASPSPVDDDRPERTLRIGELAEQTGTTPRTIRYWEELGLLGTGAQRAEGKHRVYSPADVERVSEIVQLSALLEAESARAHVRRELTHTTAPDERRRLLEEAQEHIGTQLSLVRGRLGELTQLAAELEDKQRRVTARIAELADA
jgi:MerR family transcriptional regulator, repressor of the yfmOP operon